MSKEPARSTLIETISRTLCLSLAVTVGACADAPTQSNRLDVMAERNAAPANAIGVDSVREDERLMWELAQESPSSAGMYVDELGALVIRVRDARDEGRASALLSRRLSSHEELMRGRPRTRLIRTERAEFTFLELNRWRNLAFEHVLTVVPGVGRLDLDERRNRVRLVIDARRASQVRRDVLDVLRSLGVPAAAVFFDVADIDGPYLTPLAAPTDIRWASSDPIAASLAISNPAGSCTIGAVATRDGVLGLVTASHCSYAMFSTDYSIFAVSTGQIAQEIRDPAGYACGVLECRGSDATFAATNNFQAMSVGRILRTIGPNTGSRSVDQAHPYFDVVEEADYIAYGTRIDKVGITTGWTSGYVTSTCEDATYYLGGATWKTVTCMYGTNAAVDPGDSGGPMFYRLASGDSTEVSIAGFLSGHGGGTSFFSKLGRVKQDLGGTWNFKAHAPTPPNGPLQVSIAGPIDVSSNPSCSLRYWTDVSGGDGSYTYSWSTTGTILQQYDGAMWANFPTQGGHSIDIIVTDGSGAQATATLELTSSIAGMDCYNS